MTVAELDRWALERDWGEARRARMEQHLRNFIVYPFNRSLCLRWAKAADSARRSGRSVGVADAWIAATALEHDLENLTIVTETTRKEEQAHIARQAQQWAPVSHVMQQMLPANMPEYIPDLYTNRTSIRLHSRLFQDVDSASIRLTYGILQQSSTHRNSLILSRNEQG